MSVVLRALLVLLSLVRAEPSTRDVPYELERTWNSTLRYLRVDLKWTVRESDRDVGFVMFDFVDDKKKREAALELVRVTDGAGRDGVRLRLRVEEVTIYARERFLQRLAAKLRDDYGAPPPPPKKAPPPPPADGPRAPDGGPGYTPRP